MDGGGGDGDGGGGDDDDHDHDHDHVADLADARRKAIQVRNGFQH